MIAIDNDEMINATEAAKILKMKRHTLYSWNSRCPSKLRRFKIGRSTRFLKSDVMNLHKKQYEEQLEKLKPE